MKVPLPLSPTDFEQYATKEEMELLMQAYADSKTSQVKAQDMQRDLESKIALRKRMKGEA